MIEILLWVCVGVAVGAIGSLFAMRNYLINSVEDEFHDTMDELLDQIVEVVVNVDSTGMVFVYDKESLTFLANGSSLDQVQTILADRFPNIVFIFDRMEEI